MYIKLQIFMNETWKEFQYLFDLSGDLWPSKLG